MKELRCPKCNKKLFDFDNKENNNTIAIEIICTRCKEKVYFQSSKIVK